MSETPAEISQKRGINPIWFVPIVALVLGIWMVIYTIQSQGPEITIQFKTAEGIEAGKTKIKLRNVDVGLVESVALGDDRQSVIVTASLDKSAEPLLHDDTQFWVVRPRIGKGGVTGLGTLLSGGYLQLAPGQSETRGRAFVGLEEPPVTPAGTPGVKITLTAERAGSVSPGDPILYKGYTIGRVESETFDTDSTQMRYGVFIDAPFDELLTTAHRFWDASGISVKAGADGVEFNSFALETLLIGGVEVGLPRNVGPGTRAETGAVYQLYDDYASVNQRPYRHSIQYVVRFAQSVRGLAPGAPVEFRGIRLGEVERIMLDELAHRLQGKQQGDGIPVLIRLEPARLRLDDSPAGVEQLKERVKIAIGNGMRATLATGNLLTGSLYVSMDLHAEAAPASLGEYAGRQTIPTMASGLEGIQVQITAFLEKLNALPLEGTVAEARDALASLEKLLASQGMQDLPSSLDQTLAELQTTLASFSSDSELQATLLPTIAELDATLASLRQVLDTLEEQPNALIFNREYGDDPRPPAGSRR